MELGSGEILLILIVALLIYGGRLPEVARSIGKSFGELKRGLSETRDVVTRELDPGVHVDLDLEEQKPRDTLRMARAADELAKEDISSPPAPAAEPTPHAPPAATTPTTPDEPKDVRTRHEHPN